MKARRGFTLVELVVVVAIMGILAALAVAGMRSRKSSESLSGIVFGLQTQLQGLRSAALAEQRDYLFVIVNGDGSGCGLFNPPGCTRWFILAAPDPAAWTFADFNPATPGANVGEVLERERLNDVQLQPAVAGRFGPAPFGTVQVFDPRYTRICGGGTATCSAFRFRANGDVLGELVNPDDAPGRGNAVAFVTDVELQGGTGARSILLVGFPNGILKTYPY
jgi:prepilin-type N-terminal cleavage/methylation domain-containing protein